MGANSLHRGVKDVASTRNRLDQVSIGVPDRFADVEYALSDRVVCDADSTPHLLVQLILEDQTPVVLNQDLQDLERLWTQLHVSVAISQSAPVEVQGEIVEAEATVVEWLT